MSVADSNDVVMAFAEETVWGETPGAPVFRKLRVTGERLTYGVESQLSREIAPTAARSLLRGTGGVSGDLHLDFSRGSVDSDVLLAHALRSDFAAADSGQAALSAVAPSDFTRADGDFLGDGFRPGMSVTVSGFGDPANGGSFTVAAVTATTLTVVETRVVSEAGDGDERILGDGEDLLKAGVARKSLTLEKRVSAGAQDHYLRFAGCRIDGLAVHIDAGQGVTATIGLSGGSHAVDDAPIAGAAYQSSNPNRALAGADVADISVEGVAASVSCTAIGLDLSNKLRSRHAAGGVDPVGVAYGRREVTGRLTVYFEGPELYGMFLSGSASSLSFSMDDGGGGYAVTVPNLVFHEGRILAEGPDRDLLAEVSFHALHSPAYGTDLMIHRF
jgi:hypothetical protein